MDSIDMKVEHQYALHHDHDHAFRPNELADMPADHSPHTSPPHDYSAFDFTPPTDTMYSRTFQPSYSPAQSLHPLNTTTLWPSQITNPSENTTLSHVALPIHRSIAPVTRSTPASVAPQSLARNPTPTPSKPTPAVPTSRRTLSDDDRRRMCKYNEENPTVKQTEIGGQSKSFPCVRIGMLTFVASHVWGRKEVRVIV